jgi:glutamate--cysteine ligase
MAVVKEGLQVTQAMVQEGIYTFETVNDAFAEPVIYMMDHYVVGGFYRVHTGRGQDENLNAPGMQFVPLAFEDTCLLPQFDQRDDCAPNRFYLYGVIARLALLAASLEIEQLAQQHDPVFAETRKVAGA